MTKNTLGDLNNHLFEALERVTDQSLDQEGLHKEMERSKIIVGLASQIISNGNLVLKAKVAQEEFCRVGEPMPKMLNG